VPRALIGCLFLLMAACGLRAQDPPDSPKPKIETDQPTPCPAGPGKPCALLGGRAYFPDPWKMTQHDLTWFDAMKHPAIWGTAALLVGTSVLDIEGTDHCLEIRECKEANPLMPKTVDRPRQYGTVLGVDALEVYFLGRAKKRGRGNKAFFIVYGTSLLHLAYGVQAIRLFNPSATVAPTDPARKAR
jgi:hypothetical protein